MRGTTEQGRARPGRRADPRSRHAGTVACGWAVCWTGQAHVAEAEICRTEKRLAVSGKKFEVTGMTSGVKGRRLSVSPVCPLQYIRPSTSHYVLS